VFSRALSLERVFPKEESFYVAAVVKPIFPFFSFLRFSSSRVVP
jgi:hypothetical protein